MCLFNYSCFHAVSNIWLEPTYLDTFYMALHKSSSGSSLNFLIRDFENRLSSVARRKTFVIYGFSFIQIRQEDFETVIEKLLHMLTYILRNCPVFSSLLFFLP